MIERFDPDERRDNAAHRLFAREHLRRYRIAAEAIGPVAGHGRIIDAACGTGYGSRFLAPLGGYLGLDCSAEAISRAKADHPGVEFEQTDFEDHGMRLFGQTRAVVSLETAEHLRDPDRFLATLWHRLLPFGLLVFSAPTSLTMDFDRFHRHDRDADAWRRALEAAGFHVRREVPMPFTTRIGEFLWTVPTTWRDRASVGRFWLGHPRYGLARAWEWLLLGRFSWCSTLWVCST
jgi:2-polyprenyl-3-methyl-5-hydroxy-6-metoxy-1,4-benzoquinol methylase